MDLNKKNVKAIRGIILFTVILVLIVVNFDKVWSGLYFVISIIKPFLYGGAIAFVLNIPLSAIEKYLFQNRKGKYADRLKRPVSIILSLAAVLLVVTFVFLMVIPQIVATAGELGKTIPVFLDRMSQHKDRVLAQYPFALEYLENSGYSDINWDAITSKLFEFLGGGFTSVLTSTFTVAGNIISGIVSSFIALFFSFYILAQKEKLGEQCRRILQAYCNKKVYGNALNVASLLYKNFTNFITGQCLEAVILGTMFVITLLIFRFPYALMIGILIAFTALIPIVGAFVGCFIGAFLILVDSPEKVIWFIILFLILQQIEGNFIYPRVVGNSVGLPAIWVLAAVTVGGSLMEVAGMLIFIPLFSTVYALLREDVNQKNRKQEAQTVPKAKPRK